MKTRLLAILLLFGMAIGQATAQKTDFWDGIEAFDGPTDDNPILTSQLDFYFDKMVAPLPDSIELEINRLVERTGSNPNLRDFILWHLLEKYRHPQYMSQDQVFVWLFDTYFSKLRIKDLNETNLAMIQEKAERLRRLAMFKPAPDFKLTAGNGASIDLQSVESEYTVLFFYDHECGLCKQEMRDLDSVCAERSEIKALKIDMNDDTEGLHALYNLYDIETTPLIYVLDKDKRIIAKKIQARQIGMITTLPLPHQK